MNEYNNQWKCHNEFWRHFVGCKFERCLLIEMHYFQIWFFFLNSTLNFFTILEWHISLIINIDDGINFVQFLISKMQIFQFLCNWEFDGFQLFECYLQNWMQIFQLICNWKFDVISTFWISLQNWKKYTKITFLFV